MLNLPYDSVVRADFCFERALGREMLKHHVARQQVNGHAVALRYVECLERMEGNVYLQVAWPGVEVYRDE